MKANLAHSVHSAQNRPPWASPASCSSCSRSAHLATSPNSTPKVSSPLLHLTHAHIVSPSPSTSRAGSTVPPPRAPASSSRTCRRRATCAYRATWSAFCDITASSLLWCLTGHLLPSKTAPKIGVNSVAPMHWCRLGNFGRERKPSRRCRRRRRPPPRRRRGRVCTNKRVSCINSV